MSARSLRPWGHYPPGEQTGHECRWRDELESQLSALKQSNGDTLAFGNGRSYGDLCQAASGHVLDMRGLDRFISADWERGTVTAEAGVTLEQVLDLALPHGWFLPVTPGTKFVTLGGAVANDVHGKNHHVRGTFGMHIKRFGLVRSDRGALVCSRDENTDLFAATAGGLGSTGIISWIEFQLMPVKSAMIDEVSVKFGDLADFFALSREYNASHEYTVAWIDCTGAGRGLFSAGNHAQGGDLQAPLRRGKSMPFTPPFSLINRYSVRMFNHIYYGRQRSERVTRTVGYDEFLYPLDNVRHWNRIYGPRGFQQYQCIVPHAHAEAAMPELLKVIADSKIGSFLAVLKQYGDMKSPGLLSFPLAGTSLAIDFPQHDSLNGLFARMDAIVREAGGRLYPAKDAHMAAADFQQFYPAWRRLDSLRDPALASRFWNRVTSA